MNKQAALDATLILIIVVVAVAVILGGIFGIGWLLYQWWGHVGIGVMLCLVCLGGMWTMIYMDIRHKTPRGGGGTGVC